MNDFVILLHFHLNIKTGLWNQGISLFFTVTHVLIFIVIVDMRQILEMNDFRLPQVDYTSTATVSANSLWLNLQCTDLLKNYLHFLIAQFEFFT